MTITQKSKDNVNKIHEMLLEVMVSEHRSLEEQAKAHTFDSEEEPTWKKLQYVIFQLSVGETLDKVRNLVHCLEMNEEDVNKIVSDSGLDVETAYQNAMKNMTMEIMKRLLNI